MKKDFFLKQLKFEESKKKILSVTLQDSKNGEITEWPLSFELMNLSMEHELSIETDPQAKILVYTKKQEGGEISPTIKVFYPGNQENLLFSEKYLRQHQLFL